MKTFWQDPKNLFSRLVSPAFVILTVGLGSSCSHSSPGTLFENVVIVDGSGDPSYSGSVRVVQDRIESVGDLSPREGDLVLDGNGWVLAPGFIDTHSHHDRGLLASMRPAIAAVSQGITTVVVGQDGGSRYPVETLFKEVESGPPAINVASYTGHGTLRRRVMGEDLMRPATLEEVGQMAALLRADMEAGSLGLSTGLEYADSFHSSTEEVLALARVAEEYGGRYISHIRSEDRHFWSALSEIIEVGEKVGIPVQVGHMKLAMTSLWGRTRELIDTLEAARDRGVEITADVYPYTYWQSTMTVLVPDGNFTREEVGFALREVATPDGIIFGRFSPEPSYEGSTLEEIADERGEDPVTTYLSLLEMVHGTDAPKDAAESIVARSMTEEDVSAMYQWPHTNVSSDGALAGAHPRGYGAFTRVLREQVRERRDLSLEQAVHRMTGLSAKHMGFTDRGVIREGAIADLVLFDPEKVSDRADFESPQLTSIGVHGVWVGGIRVWNPETQIEAAYPGRVIRRGHQVGWRANVSAIDEVFADYDVLDAPGCALGIVEEGDLSYGKGYGAANLEHGIAIAPNTVFRTASVGKQFTAAAIAILAREGTVSLDDPVRKWIPELPRYPVEPTIRQVVHHTSGIRDYLTLMSLRGLREDDYYTPAEVRAAIARQRELNFTPGSDYLYSNSGYFLLGEIIIEATGMTLREYAHDRIFRPLEMNSSHFHDDHTHIVVNRATGYAPTDDGYRVSVTTLDMVGDGGVFTSVEDLALWVDALNKDRVEPGLNAVLESTVPLSDGTDNSYSFGQGIGEYRGVRMVSHGGSFVGYRAQITRFPSEDVSIIVLCNRADASPGSMASQVADVVLAESLEPRIGEDGEARPSGSGSTSRSLVVEEPESFVGSYYSPELDVEYQLLIVDGALRLRAGLGIDTEVHQVGEDLLSSGRLELRFRNATEERDGFYVNAGRVRNLFFERVRN